MWEVGASEISLVFKADGTTWPSVASWFGDSICLTSGTGFPGKGCKHFRSSKLVQTKRLFLGQWLGIWELSWRVCCGVLSLRRPPGTLQMRAEVQLRAVAGWDLCIELRP